MPKQSLLVTTFVILLSSDKETMRHLPFHQDVIYWSSLRHEHKTMTEINP